MVIKRLTLHNFGVYAGTNTFVFSGEKPVVLIGGMNGRGKTTFLNAIVIALYGANSFAYKDSTYNSYGSYLGSYVNEEDGSLSSFVELEMTLNNSEEDTYSIRRSWNKKGTYVKEDISVQKNHCYDEFLANNWALFIEGLIPSALSQYFFFDGDNIAELATGSIDDKMKKSIKTLLGISNLDLLEKDLRRVKRSAEKCLDDVAGKEESEKKRAIMEAAKRELEQIDKEIMKLEEIKEVTEKQLEKKKLNYIAKGGKIVEERQQLINERSELNAFLKQINNDLVDNAGSNLPLLMVSNYLKKINNIIKSEKDSTNIQIANTTIKEVFRLIDMNDAEKKVVKKFLLKIDELAEQSNADLVINASEQMSLQLENLIKYQLNERKEFIERKLKNKEKIKEKITEIDAQLSVDIDEKLVAKIYAQIIRKEREIVEIDEKISRLTRKRSEANGTFIRANSEFNKVVEEYLSKLDVRDESERIIKYTDKAERILLNFKIRMQKRKIEKLSKTITICYRKLRNKEKLISKIEMDAESLDFIYLDNRGKIVPKNSLSQGEKQMMIISILWALALNSKRKLPVIIDTPLARLDSAHRLSLIKKYFPNASEQTIILSTDSEIVGDYYKVLRTNVSDEFTLIYDDEKRCSKIVKGYFGESNDSKTN